MSRVRRGVLPPPQEVIAKLEKIVNDGRSYEAQQMYKTQSARYMAVQRYAEALDIIEAGSLIQLQKQQVTCGSELAAMFVDTLIKGKVPFSEEILGRLTKIYQAFPKLSVPEHVGDEVDDDMHQLSEAFVAARIRVDGCSSFLKSAIKWSAEFGAPRTGSPEMYNMLAEYIYSESPELDMAKVSSYFVRGNNPEKFASVLVNFMGKCYTGEDDTAIARAVLLYLAQGNLKNANCLMDEIRNQLDSKDLTFPESELTVFILFLLQTLERDALPLFRMLIQKFKSSIDREPSFNELLDEIAEKFYGVRRQSGIQGMFGDIFKMMEAPM